MSREATSSPRRLHLGCGAVTPPGWVNVDNALGARAAKLGPISAWARKLGLTRREWSPEIVIHDLRRRFPWPDGSADVIYSAHTLEHLTRRQGEYFLFECARVLAPGGVIRILVADLSAILADYEKGAFPSTEFVERLGVATERSAALRSAHRCMYDAEGLLEAMFGVGLEARVHAPGLSRIQGIEDVESDPDEGCLIVEGVKAPL